jgi:4-hydroxybenzoate polyprenyltransferase
MNILLTALAIVGAIFSILGLVLIILVVAVILGMVVYTCLENDDDDIDEDGYYPPVSPRFDGPLSPNPLQFGRAVTTSN